MSEAPGSFFCPWLSDFSSTFCGKDSSSPSHFFGALVKNQLAVCVWVYFWTPHPVASPGTVTAKTIPLYAQTPTWLGTDCRLVLNTGTQRAAFTPLGGCNQVLRRGNTACDTKSVPLRKNIPSIQGEKDSPLGNRSGLDGPVCPSSPTRATFSPEPSGGPLVDTG